MIKHIMNSISPAPADADADADAEVPTYTTIPISGADVITRSIQNLTASFSRCRPWPDFLATGAIDLPSSLSAASLRLRKNVRCFSTNYAVVASTCAAVSLIGSPVALIVVGFGFALWLVLFFFREDPMVIMGRHISDRAVIVALGCHNLVHGSVNKFVNWRFGGGCGRGNSRAIKKHGRAFPRRKRRRDRRLGLDFS